MPINLKAPEPIQRFVPTAPGEVRYYSRARGHGGCSPPLPWVMRPRAYGSVRSVSLKFVFTEFTVGYHHTHSQLFLPRLVPCWALRCYAGQSDS